MTPLLLLAIIFTPAYFYAVLNSGVAKRPRKVARKLRTNRQPRDIWGRFETNKLSEIAFYGKGDLWN